MTAQSVGVHHDCSKNAGFDLVTGSYAAERWQPDLEAQARWRALEAAAKAMRAARWAAKRAKIKV